MKFDSWSKIPEYVQVITGFKKKKKKQDMGITLDSAK